MDERLEGLLPEEARGANAAAASGSSEASSDNESWTILDEEEEEKDRMTAEEEASSEAGSKEDEGVVESTASLTLSTVTSSSTHGFNESDSDIETLDRGFSCEGVPSNLEQQTDFASTSFSSDQREEHEIETPSEFSEERESDEEDSDDAEYREDINFLMPRTNDITSQRYPSEELPEEFAEATIKRGRTYNHQRNQDVNVVLTGVLIVVVAMVLGLGIGHFLGWSERLELQEHYADVREEKMEELAENLVTCMTGEEGKGGDDQDLDDKVIQQLWVENKDLKEQLEALKKYQEQDDSSRKIESELNVILRDRINDLLIANADLEKEVTRLRSAQSTMLDVQHSKNMLEETKSHLQETRKNLNEIAHENEQLKIAIAKARYSTPSMPIGEKARLNDLQTENEELKHEIRRFRYLPRSYLDPQKAEISQEEEEESPSSDLDEGFVDLDSEVETDAENQFLDEDEHSFVAAVKVEDPIVFQAEQIKHLPSAPLGDIFPDDLLTEFDSFTPEIMPLPFTKLGGFDEADDKVIKRSSDQAAPPHKETKKEKETKSFASLFKTLSELVINSTNTLFNKESLFDMSSVVKAIGKVNKKAQKIIKKDVLNEENLKKVADFAAVAEDVLIRKWQEVQNLAESENFQQHAKTTKVAMDKLGKTLVATLHSIKDSLKKDNLEESWSKIHGFMQTKWQNVLDKFHSKVRKFNVKPEEPSSSQPEKPAAAEKEEEKEEKPAEDKIVEEPKKPSDYSPWSYNPAKTENGTSWIFERAQNRQKSRKDSLRSDWLFNRARDRERFHDVSKAEWHSKRLFSRRCEEDEDGEEHCEDIGQLNPAEVNRISHRKKKGETEEEDVENEVPTFRSKFLYANLGGDEDDDKDIFEGLRRGVHTATFDSFGFFDDDEDDDEDDEDEWIRPMHAFQKQNRRHFHQGQRGDRFDSDSGHRQGRSNRQDKRSRYQHSRSDHHHYRKNSRPKQHSFSFET